MQRYQYSHTSHSNPGFCCPCMTSHPTKDCTVFSFSHSAFPAGKKMARQSNSRLLIICIDYFGVSWLFPSPPLQGNGRLVPFFWATTWLVDDEASPPCTMAFSDLLSVTPLCWLSLLWHVCWPPHGILVSVITSAIFLLMESSFSQVPTISFAFPSSQTQYSEMEPLKNSRLVYKCMPLNCRACLIDLGHRKAKLTVNYFITKESH